MPLHLYFPEGLTLPRGRQYYCLPLSQGRLYCDDEPISDGDTHIDLLSLIHTNSELAIYTYVGHVRSSTSSHFSVLFPGQQDRLFPNDLDPGIPNFDPNQVQAAATTPTNRLVICKLSANTRGLEALQQKEWTAYRVFKIAGTQGDVVPVCFGFYKDWAPGCLVLEYAGEGLRMEFESLESPLKLRLIHALNKIYDAGIEHNAISQNRIRLLDTPQGTRLTVINFLHSTQRTRPRQANVWDPGELKPSPSEQDGSIWREPRPILRPTSRTWRPLTITLWNHREIYPVTALNDPQVLIAQRPQAYFDTLYSAALATEEVHWVFMDYLARWLPELYALIPDDDHRHWPIIIDEMRNDLTVDDLSQQLGAASLDVFSPDQLAEAFGRSLGMQA